VGPGVQGGSAGQARIEPVEHGAEDHGRERLVKVNTAYVRER
jgi:hypothetical protein